MTDSRKVLLTGAAGYIGSLVVAELAADRDGIETIVATDVRATPVSEQLDGVVYHELDVRDATGLVALLKQHHIDTVVHLAAIVSPSKDSDPALEYAVDVDGTRNVLEACVAAEVARIIVTSSGAAYGYHADNRPLLTEDCPLRGNDEFAYSRHKRLVEEMLADYRREHPQLQQLIFRPGTVLGPSTHNQITNLFEKAMVLGIGGAATPFVFIWDQDVASCINIGVRKGKTGIYNLAGDGVMTLREIAARLGKRYVALPRPLVTSALRVMSRLGVSRYGPEQVRFLQYRPVLDNRALKRDFGYTPRRTSRQVFELYAEAHA